MVLNLFGKEVLHGTSVSRMRSFFDSEQDLYGTRYPEAPKLSATLTDNPKYAALCAFAAVNIDFGGIATILHFKIPSRELVDEGQVGNNRGVRGYSTIYTVEDIDTIPDQYLQYLCISREQAAKDVDSGKVVFYRVPHGYFYHLETVVKDK